MLKRIISTIKEAARRIKGAAKWLFMAKVTGDYFHGSSRKAERIFGWSRKTVEKGLSEKRSGIIYVNKFSLRGRKKTEEQQPFLERDIRELIDGQSQADPKMRSTLCYTRISARAVKEALIKEKGYIDEGLPSRQTIGAILNRLGYRLRKTQKTKPIKKIKETDDIFENVHRENKESDKNPKSLRISVDCKAKVKIGNLSRGGKDRTFEAREADDHDTAVKAVLTPLGIEDVMGGRLSIVFGQSYETSDFIVDGLEYWWNRDRHLYSGIKELAINLDNGPSVKSSRTQFIKRMVGFSRETGLKIKLIYYPPYHSKYNSVERCWAALEKFWNGAILDSVNTAVQWASNMVWKGVSPLVYLITKTYKKGIRLCKKEMKKFEIFLKRSKYLPKWDVTIAPS